MVYNLIRLQINLIVRLSPPVIVALEISLPYLVRVFRALPIGQKTFTAFLERLHHDGFLRNQDYNEETKEIAPDAQRLYIHWFKDLSPLPRVWGCRNLLRLQKLQFQSSI
ncbi:hypothetical protein OROMI_010336 [Orobanche minor]